MRPTDAHPGVKVPLIALLLVPGFLQPGSLTSAPPNAHLVSEIPCPDPYVFHDGSDWYVFGTGTRPFFLQGKELGEGKMRQVFLDLDYADCPVKVAQIWGFVVHRHSDGSYHAYGTLHLGYLHTVVGYFEPQGSDRWEKGKPITRWKFRNIVVGDPSRQDWKYYESKILEDADRTIYLMYVANTGRDNVIVAQKMKSWGEIDRTAPPRVLLRPEGYRSEDRNNPGSMQLVEGGSIFKWKGKYILLYSVGDYLLNKYKLGMAFSDSLIPARGQTYRKVKLPDPKRVWDKNNHPDEIGYLLQSEKPQWPNYVGGLALGPGLGSIVRSDEKLWLFFHGYQPDDPERKPENRFVYRLPVTIGIDGGQPSLRWVHAQLPDEQRLIGFRRDERTRALRAFARVLKPRSAWKGTSDWGEGKNTKSELHCLKTEGRKSEWDFVFVQGSIFNTPVPFRQRWTGELVDNNREGVFLRLTRFDGKAFHEYRINGNGDLHGSAVDAPFSYRFQLKGQAQKVSP